MTTIYHIFTSQPLFALFLTIALGYFVGKFRIKQFKLGGIAGSLLVGVAIGQLGIKIPSGIDTIFFALFIYAVGYQGGPQFFNALNKQTLVELISATITCILGLICVIVAAKIYHLDRGTAAGLAAGGLTQSAIIGTAGDAIKKLGVSAEMKQVLQSNVAVGYAVCYIFGSFGPILLLATLFPGMMKWNLRLEAKKLAQRNKDGGVTLEAGQFNAIREIDTRVFAIDGQSKLIDVLVKNAFAKDAGIVIEAIIRNGQMILIDESTKIVCDDVLAITATINQFVEKGHLIGEEIVTPKSMKLIEEIKKVIITNKNLNRKPLKEITKELNTQFKHGIFITKISHMGEKIAPRDDFQLRLGDEVDLVGKPSDIAPAAKFLGYTLSQEKLTDFIFFGLGMCLGILIGMISFHIFGVAVTLGSGVGCLFSGLVFGWLKSTHPRYGSLPMGASNFLRDFGLAVFVAAIGITAGPQAIETMKKYGLELFFLGVGVTLIPQIIAFYVSYYLLKIKNPITLLATIAGGRSANPGFAALLEKAGNSTPVVPFTATYAIANILLTLWGPLIIGIIATNPS
jgi:putative transport protein